MTNYYDTGDGINKSVYKYTEQGGDVFRYSGGLTVLVDNIWDVITQNGTSSAATDGSGDVVITFDTAFTAAPTSVVITAGDTPYFFAVQSKTASGFTVRIYDTSGAAVLTTAVDFDWIAMK